MNVTPHLRLPFIALATAVMTLLSTSALASPAPDGGQGEAASAAQLRVIQHNTDHVPAAWDFVVGQIDEFQPQLVAVQEVCRPWFEALQADHPNWTFAYHPRKLHFGNSKNPGCGGDWIGELVIYTGAANRPTMTPDYSNNNADGGEKFGMACVEFRQRGIPTLGCSTHLSAYPTSGGRGTQPERGPQVQSIMDHTAPYRDAGWAVVIGGDFNMTSAADNPKQTPDMNLLMGPAVGGTGDFYDGSQHECDCRLTKPTTDKNQRIDYVFWAAGRTPFPGAARMERLDSPAGHHLLRSIGMLARSHG